MLLEDKLLFGKCHQPNQMMKSGIVAKLVRMTLAALPMKVSGDAGRPREVRIGLNRHPAWEGSCETADFLGLDKFFRLDGRVRRVLRWDRDSMGMEINVTGKRVRLHSQQDENEFQCLGIERSVLPWSVLKLAYL